MPRRCPPSLASLALAAALLSCGRGARAEGAAAEERAWWVPDGAKLQFAGNVGFLSPAVSWATDGGAVESDLFFGWVPEAVGGEHLFAFTGKLTWFPWRLERRGGWRIQPLSLAVQLTYTLGAEYYLTLPDWYPEGYYPLPTALRAGLAIGAGAGRPLWGVPYVGGYAELVALDMMLLAWATNPASLGPADVFSLALGLKVGW